MTLALLSGVVLGILAALLWLRRPGRESVHAPAPSCPPAPAVTAPPSPAAAPAAADPAAPAVEEAMLRFLREQPGRWDLYYAALPEGEPVWLVTDREPMASASLIKLFIMATAYEQIECGLLEHDAVYPQMQAMITVSDNPSANGLIEALGAGDPEKGMAAVNDYCLRQGYAGTALNRLMLEESGLQNYTSAGDCAGLLRSIYRGDCVSPAASEEMMQLLLEQTVNNRLPAGLPEGSRTAHKTGDLAGICVGDVGVIFTERGDYLLCAIVNDPPDDREAVKAIGELSAQVYALVTGESP